MANNVDTNVEFKAINADALTELVELFANPPKYDSGQDHIDYAMMKVLGITDEDQFDSDDETGSKWVYIEDHSFESGHTYLRLVSAWDTPLKGIRAIFSHLAQFDKNLIVSLHYDDGGYSFGWVVLSVNGDGIKTAREDLDRDDLINMIAKDDPVFAKMDEDDEGYDEYVDENFYEYFHSYADMKIQNAVKAIQS
jgi:hypothetical protein